MRVLDGDCSKALASGTDRSERSNPSRDISLAAWIIKVFLEN